MDKVYIRDLDETDQSPLRTWGPRIVHIRTSISGLDSALIPFAVLKSDPLPDFQQYVEPRLHHARDRADALAIVREAWCQPFASLREEQKFFLYAWSSVASASSRVKGVAGLTFAIATPGPFSKRWLTTYAMQRQGELVAWCEEIDMQEREVVEIVFAGGNMLPLLNVVKSNKMHVGM